MSILIICGRTPKETESYNWYMLKWQEALLKLDPSLDIRIWPEIGNPEDITFVLLWRHPHGVCEQFPNLRCIASMGAGVEHIMTDPNLPTHIPVVRIMDNTMGKQMVQYAVAATLFHIRLFDRWQESQRIAKWDKFPPFGLYKAQVGVMGLGYLGQQIAIALTQMGLPVSGWSNSKKSIDNVQSFAGKNEFELFLSQSDVLICMLPLTPETKGILNKNTFNLLPPNAYIINMGRGQHLIEQDLIDAIDSGQLSGACLDVFEEEPLPKQHPFWSQPKIKITPHIASVTSPTSVAPQILENYQRAQRGDDLINRANVTRGY